MLVVITIVFTLYFVYYLYYFLTCTELKGHCFVLVSGYVC